MYHDVLIVEDEEPLRRVISRNLRARGHAVREAASAAEAIASVRAAPPDLLLLDINLPDRTGWDVLRDLSQHAPLPATVVVSAVKLNPARLEEFGVLCHLPKPLPLDALLRIVAGGLTQPES